MSQRRWTLLGLLLASSAVAAGEEVALPSDPQTWYGDLRPMITPTEQCPGGTVEQLRKRMSVSEPSSTRALDTAQRFSQSTLQASRTLTWCTSFISAPNSLAAASGDSAAT